MATEITTQDWLEGYGGQYDDRYDDYDIDDYIPINVYPNRESRKWDRIGRNNIVSDYLRDEFAIRKWQQEHQGSL